MGAMAEGYPDPATVQVGGGRCACSCGHGAAITVRAGFVSCRHCGVALCPACVVFDDETETFECAHGCAA